MSTKADVNGAASGCAVSWRNFSMSAVWREYKHNAKASEFVHSAHSASARSALRQYLRRVLVTFAQQSGCNHIVLREYTCSKASILVQY